MTPEQHQRYLEAADYDPDRVKKESLAFMLSAIIKDIADDNTKEIAKCLKHLDLEILYNLEHTLRMLHEKLKTRFHRR